MNEIEESEFLLSQATFPSVKKLLHQHISYLHLTDEFSEEPAEVPAPVIPAAPAVVVPPPTPVIPVAPVAPVEPVVKIAAPAPTAPIVPIAPIAPVRASILSTKGPSVNFIPIGSFAWDQGEYGTPTVSIFVDDLEGVGAIKDSVEFSCTKSSFDLKITGLKGKNYRLVKDNLDKDIVVSESKIIVKKDKIVIKLKKVKGDYSYENWTNLTSKKKRDATSEADKKANPMGGIMDMMKDMYDDGDESMKKIIGEAMMKSRSGEKADAPAMGGFDDV